MKTAHDPDTLTRTEIELLKRVTESSSSVSELGKRLGKSQPRTSIILKKLQEKGFVALRRKGMSKLVEFDDTKHAILMRNLLLRYNHIPWENLLTSSSFTILNGIVHGLTNQELEEAISKTTLWRHLRDLMAHGIVIQEDNNYKINPRHETLINFFEEYANYTIQQLANEASEKASIIWRNFIEFLIRVPYQDKIRKPNFFLTALSALAKYGIEIISDYDYYFYTNRKRRLSKEDYTLHTLLVEKGNVTYVTYALLSIKKFREELSKSYLLKEAQRFGLEKQVNAMLLFLERKRPPANVVLPSWTEFKQKAEQYNVM